VQWHAIAFLLTELIIRTEGEQVDRAWKAIDFVVGRRWQDDQALSHKLKGHLWKPLRRLMDRARAERDKAIANKQKQEFDTNGKVEAMMSSYDPAVPMINLDFGVERLYPLTDSITEDTSTNWADPRLDQNVFLTPASQTVVTATNNTTKSIDQTITPTTSGQLPAQLDLTSNWIMNDTTLATDPLGSSASPSIASPLLADGSVNWANWDDMVREFGMDVDPADNSTTNINQTGFTSTFGPLSQWY
jgi:hypothetical protein